VVLVPDWWFAVVLVVAVTCGVAGVAFWPTYTSPMVVFYGIAMCLVFVVPIGVIKAMTRVEVSLAILAEFIGGSLVPGNALAMNYMKAYGYVTCAHALGFSHDLKLAHYVKVRVIAPSLPKRKKKKKRGRTKGRGDTEKREEEEKEKVKKRSRNIQKGKKKKRTRGVKDRGKDCLEDLTANQCLVFCRFHHEPHSVCRWLPR
jgi:hypothetical protein